MQRTLLVAKIHGCYVTEANLNYVGSIGIDSVLLAAAGIVQFEQVQVVNVNNGARFITYAISSAPNSGAIELNGAAARWGSQGDRLIIMTYGQFSSNEIHDHFPTVVFVDTQNQLQSVRNYDEFLLNPA